MAEQENVEKKEGAPQEGQNGKGLTPRVLPGLMLGVIVVALAGLGFCVGRMFGTRGPAQTAAAAEPALTTEAAHPQEAGAAAQTTEGWFYDLDPVVANLNEPGVTRYVRVALTLEMNSAAPGKEGVASLDLKKPLVKHWLTLYLANQTIEDIRGERNLLRMQTQISDGLNQTLFPGSKAQIKRILFKEFAIQ
jgi:flagellar FliL protein